MKVDYIHHCGDDLSVVNAARVSFACESVWVDEDYITDPSGAFREVYSQGLSVRDKKLIDYLARNKHFSPFNHNFITLRVKAPIFVARQLVKHEYMPWNEVSRRYVDDEPEFFPMEWRSAPDGSIKQGSGNSIDLSETLLAQVQFVEQYASEVYENLLKEGAAPEQARGLLPQTLMTEWWWSGTLKAWSKMHSLRVDPHAQKETQQLAIMCGDLIEPTAPFAWGKLKEYSGGLL